jgi:hypothetical protein
LILGVGKEVFVAVVVLEASADGAGLRHVPLADHPGGVAFIEKYFSQGGAGGEESSFISEPFTGRLLRVGEGADPGLVRVNPGHQRSAGWTAAGAGVEGRELGSSIGESVEVGGGDFSSVAGEIRESQIVGKDEKNVGSLRCPEREHEEQ